MKFKNYKKVILCIIFVLCMDLTSCMEKAEEVEEQTKIKIAMKENSVNDLTDINDMNDLNDEEYYIIDIPYIATRSKVDRISFVGDIYISNKVRKRYDEKGIKGIIDDSYYQIMNGSDICVGNLECAITDNLENEADKKYTFAVPEEYTKVIKEVGIDILTLANNHILDYGIDALYNTMKKLKESEINYIGAGKNEKEAKKAEIKIIDGKKYAFIAASCVLANDNWKATKDSAGVSNGYDISSICAEIKKIRPYVDKIFVYMHWGVELDEKSTEKQQLHAKRIVEAGADLVVGSHPHVVQEIEYYKEVPIIYSLGNFIYGTTQKEMMLLDVFVDYSVNPKGDMQIVIHPGISNYEKVIDYCQPENMRIKCQNMQLKSPSCFIAENGFVFSMKQVEEALAQRASESEVNMVITDNDT